MARRTLNFIMWIAAFLLLLFLLFKLFVFSRGFGYDIFSNQAKDSPEHAVESAITIRDKETLVEIGRDLKNKGIVNNAYIFALSAWTMDDHDKIVPGEYNINSAQRPSELIEIFAGESEEEDRVLPDTGN